VESDWGSFNDVKIDDVIEDLRDGREARGLMADHSRALRLAERIKVLAASALAKIVKDPDLGFVTFTDARVTPDLMQARLFYTVFWFRCRQGFDCRYPAEKYRKAQGRDRKTVGNQNDPNPRTYSR